MIHNTLLTYKMKTSIPQDKKNKIQILPHLLFSKDSLVILKDKNLKLYDLKNKICSLISVNNNINLIVTKNNITNIKSPIRNDFEKHYNSVVTNNNILQIVKNFFVVRVIYQSKSNYLNCIEEFCDINMEVLKKSFGDGSVDDESMSRISRATYYTKNKFVQEYGMLNILITTTHRYCDYVHKLILSCSLRDSKNKQLLDLFSHDIGQINLDSITSENLNRVLDKYQKAISNLELFLITKNPLSILDDNPLGNDDDLIKKQFKIQEYPTAYNRLLETPQHFLNTSINKGAVPAKSFSLELPSSMYLTKETGVNNGKLFLPTSGQDKMTNDNHEGLTGITNNEEIETNDTVGDLSPDSI